MSKAYTEISAGLKEAISHAKGKKTRTRVHRPESIDVKAIREKTGMSQQRQWGQTRLVLPLAMKYKKHSSMQVR